MRHFWSTETTPAAARFTYWREAVCAAVLNVDTEPADTSDLSGFHGSIAAEHGATLALARFRSSPHRIRRTRNLAAGAGDDRVLVSLQRSGRGVLEQGDRREVLLPGDIGIVDGGSAFSVTFPDPVERILVLVPRQILSSRAPWLGSRPFARIKGEAPMAAPLGQYIRTLADQPAAPAGESDLIADSLCALIAVASYGAIARPAASERNRAAVLAHIRGHLHDPALSAATAASALRLSARSIHLALAETGRSFGAWVLELRLQAVARALSDPAQTGRGIAEIAYSWGFNDLSHFNRSFKSRFGAPPKAYAVSQRLASTRASSSE